MLDLGLGISLTTSPQSNVQDVVFYTLVAHVFCKSSPAVLTMELRCGDTTHHTMPPFKIRPWSLGHFPLPNLIQIPKNKVYKVLLKKMTKHRVNSTESSKLRLKVR